MSENVFLRKPKEQRRVVVTGLGVVTPLGLTVADNWHGLTEGKSGIQTVTSFDVAEYDVKIAGEVKNFNPDTIIEKKEQKKMARFIHLSLLAAAEAITDSGIDFSQDELLKKRAGAFVGVGLGGLRNIEEQVQVLVQKGPSRVTPFFIPMVISNMAAGQISIKYGLKGPNYAVTSACSSGAHAIGEAVRYIRDGICDVMIAGGAESTVTPTAIAGFSSMKALSSRNEQPSMASRPFDKDRDGFVLSEGAGILILEDFERASRRGAKIYAEVTGYGASSDANHITNPHPEGEGAAFAMKLALQDAGLNPEQINYINAHGTSTPVGDGLETFAIKKVFGDHAKKLWVSSTKSMTGHTLGAAGAIESVYSILALYHQVAPPTINLDNPSSDCDLDYVPHTARQGKLNHVANNSFGFGGTNASVVFSKI